MPFVKDKFCDENRIWDDLRPYLKDRPQQPWTTFAITNMKVEKKARNKSMRKLISRKSSKISRKEKRN